MQLLMWCTIRQFNANAVPCHVPNDCQVSRVHILSLTSSQALQRITIMREDISLLWHFLRACTLPFAPVRPARLTVPLRLATASRKAKDFSGCCQAHSNCRACTCSRALHPFSHQSSLIFKQQSQSSSNLWHRNIKKQLSQYLNREAIHNQDHTPRPSPASGSRQVSVLLHLSVLDASYQSVRDA